MSLRERIVVDIETVLKNAEDPRFGLVHRGLYEEELMSRQSYPAVFIQTADEIKEDLSMATSGIRSSTLVIRLQAYVNGNNVDTLRNDIIERIEEVLEQDRTRGGLARFTRVTEVDVDFDVIEPHGLVEILVEVYYTYTRGTA